MKRQRTLAACPFCGDSKGLSIAVEKVAVSEKYTAAVQCDCGARGPEPEDWLTDSTEAERLAALYWNRRTDPASNRVGAITKKVCKRCKEEKPVGEFQTTKYSTYESFCRTCKNKAAQASWHKYKDRYKQRKRE